MYHTLSVSTELCAYTCTPHLQLDFTFLTTLSHEHTHKITHITGATGERGDSAS